MSVAFVVVGTTGQYEDIDDQIVAVCLTRDAADKFLEKVFNWFALQGYSRQGHVVAIGLDIEYREELTLAFKAQFNTCMWIAGNGVMFAVREAMLVES